MGFPESLRAYLGGEGEAAQSGGQRSGHNGGGAGMEAVPSDWNGWSGWSPSAWFDWSG